MPNQLRLLIPALALPLVLAACGSSSKSTGSSASSSSNAQPASHTTGASGATVKTASGAMGTILVDSQGRTLYHLSGEQNGKFICTSSACTGVWRPLTVAPGTQPGGEVGSLSTVTRPDGTTQVTYKGTPLYTFAQDQQPGETKGQGIKDVGTWRVVTTGSAAATPTTSTTQPATSSSESKYGY